MESRISFGGSKTACSRHLSIFLAFSKDFRRNYGEGSGPLGFAVGEEDLRKGSNPNKGTVEGFSFLYSEVLGGEEGEFVISAPLFLFLVPVELTISTIPKATFGLPSQ